MKTKIRRSQLLVIGCFFGFFLFTSSGGLRSRTGRPARRKTVLWPSAGDAACGDGLRRLRKGF